MNENEQPIPEPTPPQGSVGSSEGSRPIFGPSLGDIGTAPPAPSSWTSAPGQWASVPVPPQATRGRRFPRLLASRTAGWVVAAVLACAVVGLSVVVATTPSTTTARFPASRLPAGRLAPGSGPFAGRFGAISGGASGTVDSVSVSSFTMTASAGQEMTVDEQSSTTYRSGASSASASAVKTGARVLVLGSTSGSTITATQVIVLPSGGGAFGFPRASTS